MRGVQLVVAAVFCAAGCVEAESDSTVAAAQQAILGGEDDGGVDPADPAVVFVLVQQTSSDHVQMCTGTVIAPKVVLTAAHCLDSVGKDSIVSVSLEADLRADLTAGHVPRGLLPAVSVSSASLWKRNSSGDYDIGFVIMKAPLAVAPIPINRVDLAAPAAASLRGARLRVVGYGLTHENPSGGNGARRVALNTLDEVQPLVIRAFNPDHRFAEGDSGGPGLMVVDGKESIVGITAHASYDTKTGAFVHSTFTRVDAFAAFIDQVIAAAEKPTPVDDGGKTDDVTSPESAGMERGCSFCRQAAPARSALAFLFMSACLVLFRSVRRTTSTASRSPSL